MNWKEVRISLNLEAVEAAINILQEYGTRGVITKNIEDNKEKSRQLVTAYFPDNTSPGYILPQDYRVAHAWHSCSGQWLRLYLNVH